MIYFYLLFNIIIIIASLLIYKKLFNPLTLYAFVWSVMLVGYEVKLVTYFDLTLKTWIIIFIFQIVYSCGCLLGTILLFPSGIVKYYEANNYYQKFMLEKKLKYTIIILSIIASIAIIPNFVDFIISYGSKFMSLTNRIYNDRLTGNRSYHPIPYLGTLNHLAIILAVIYIKRFKIKMFTSIPFILVFMDLIPSGARGGFVLVFMYIIIPFLISGRQKKLVLNKKQKGTLLMLSFIFMGIFIKLSINRSTWITSNPYMSPAMQNLVVISPAIYKTYLYFTSPVGVLNAFLSNPYYIFGINSLGMFRNIINKLGGNVQYERYQQGYDIPMNINVGTYIRELIQDFSFFGGMLVIFIIAFIFSRNYEKYRRYNFILNEIYTIILGTVILLSFFVFWYRETVFWVITILGIPIGLYLNQYCKKKR